MVAAISISAATAPRARRAPLANRSWFEALAAAAVLLPLLFIPQLSSAGPALFYGAAAIYAYAHRREAKAILIRRWPILLVPAFALASTIWSDYPAVSLKHACELTLTMCAALLFSGGRRQDAFLFGACAAFGLYLAVSLALGHTVAMGSVVGGDDQRAFAGLNGGKNLMGMTAAMAAIATLFLVFRSLRVRSLVGALCGFGLLALSIYLIVLARSAGAVVAVTLAVAAFLTIASLGLFPAKARPAICGLLVAALIALGIAGYAAANSIEASTLDLFHKDHTLTGRSYLWYRAAEFIHERPVLGHGFEAFWVRGNPNAEGLWEYAQIRNRTGFNFHNTLIELLVHLGWVGAVLVLGVFAYAATKLLGRSLRWPSLVGATYVALAVFHLARTPFESLDPSSVDFATFLMTVALG
ncbi:MAG: O-antigen ligase family protein, partial [Caulobacteraceae bacterium]